MRLLVVLFIILFFSGCNENNKETKKPYIFEAKVQHDNKKQTVKQPSVLESLKIKAKTQKEIALINKEKDIAVEKLRQESIIEKEKIKKDVAFKKSETDLLMMNKTIKSQENNFIITLVVILVVASLLVFFFYKYRKDKLLMHQNEIDKEIYLKEKEMQAQLANRILDTLENKTLNSSQETKLIETFTKTINTSSQKLIE